jgi:hypothetical protein
MSETYPYPCVHCGLCCLATACPVAIDLIHAEKGKPCPALQWTDDGKSQCGLITGAKPEWKERMASAIGSGTGCDMKGRVMNSRTGVMVDFASLPDEMKMKIGERARYAQITLINNEKKE